MAREDDTIAALALEVEAKDGRSKVWTRDRDSCRSPGARRGGSITRPSLDRRRDPNTKATRGNSACSGSTGYVEVKLNASHHHRISMLS